jgi:hypothetical protein
VPTDQQCAVSLGSGEGGRQGTPAAPNRLETAENFPQRNPRWHRMARRPPFGLLGHAIVTSQPIYNRIVRSL